MLICDSESKVCIVCGKDKPLTEYYVKSGRKDGRQSDCKECARKKAAQYRENNKAKINANREKWLKNNPDKRKETALKYWLKRTYNITLEEYNNLLREQKGVCKICEGICKNHDRLSVDHDHTTGEVRGLLCGKCNMALGLLQDSPTILQRAMEYLKK